MEISIVNINDLKGTWCSEDIIKLQQGYRRYYVNKKLYTIVDCTDDLSLVNNQYILKNKKSFYLYKSSLYYEKDIRYWKEETYNAAIDILNSLKEINEKKSSAYEMIKSNDISTIKLGRNLICIVNNANNYYELLKKFKKL